MIEKLRTACNDSILIIGLLCSSVIIAVCSMFTMMDSFITGAFYSNLKIAPLVSLLAVVIIWLCYHRRASIARLLDHIDLKWILIVSFITQIATGLVWSLWISAVPDASDIPELKDATLTMIHDGQISDRSHVMGDDFTKLYMERFPYQSGYAIYMYVFYRLFGYNDLPLYVLNAVYMYLATVILSFIVKELSNARWQKTTLILTTLYFPLQMSGSRLYPNVIALPLSLLVVLTTIRILKSDGDNDSSIGQFLHYNKLDLLGLIVATVLMTWFKPNTMIFCIAVMVVLGCSFRWKKAMVALLVAASMMVGSMSAPALFSKMSGLDMKNNKQPAVSWIAMGFTRNDDIQHCNGCFHVKYTLDTFRDSPDETRSKELSYLKQNLKALPSYEYGGVFGFFLHKMEYMWAEPSFSQMRAKTKEYEYERLVSAYPGWEKWDGSANKYLDKSPIRTMTRTHPYADIMYAYFDLMQEILVLLSGLSLIRMVRRRKTIKIYELLPLLVVIGGFLFHSFWEVQPSYSIPYFMCLFSYVGLTYNGDQQSSTDSMIADSSDSTQ